MSLPWIKASERNSEPLVMVHARLINSGVKILAIYAGENKYKVVGEDLFIASAKIEWLDETAPSFTLEQMKEAYNEGYKLEACGATQYFREQFNIDISTPTQ